MWLSGNSGYGRRLFLWLSGRNLGVLKETVVMTTTNHGTSTTDFGLIAQEQTITYDFAKAAEEAAAARTRINRRSKRTDATSTESKRKRSEQVDNGEGESEEEKDGTSSGNEGDPVGPVIRSGKKAKKRLAKRSRTAKASHTEPKGDNKSDNKENEIDKSAATEVIGETKSVAPTSISDNWVGIASTTPTKTTGRLLGMLRVKQSLNSDV